MALKYDKTKQLSPGVSVSSRDAGVVMRGHYCPEVSDTEEQTASWRDGKSSYEERKPKTTQVFRS